ncbi:MAG: M12 family metallo-peptidase [Acidobacteriota bacterium]|nr:M12 family metallo-peptidase [Acidobacteriota bacterium]
MKRRTFPRAALATLAVFFLLALTFFASPAASTQVRRAARQDVERTLEGFDELTLDPSSALREVRKTGGLQLNTSRGTFNLALEPFDIRTADYRSVEVEADGTMHDLPREPSHAFKGTVRGMAGTQVRLILDEQEFEGIIVTPDERYFVEPERRLSPAAGTNDFVFYPESGVKQKDMGACGTTLAQRVGGQASRVTTEHLKSSENLTASKGLTTSDAFAPMPQARVATEADFEFTQLDGGPTATNQDINNVMMAVDAIYNQQLGIDLRVSFQRTWTADNDPYSSTDPAGALNELADNYDKSFTNAGQSVPSRDLVHMFTGKTLKNANSGSTSVIGISFVGVVCEFSASAFGISESKFNGTNTTSAQRTVLTAHEIGHNFGACHPDDGQCVSPQPSDCATSIMHSSIQTNGPLPVNFCQFSIDQITDFTTNEGGCLNRLAAQGCTYSIDKSAASFTNGGGTANVNVTAGAGCAWSASEGAPWLSVASGQTGTGNGTVSISVNPNTNTGPRSDAVDIGGQKFSVNEAASATCPLTPIGIGQTLTGSLDNTDCFAGQPDRQKAFGDLYTFTARAGQRIKIEMTATASLDTFIYLFGPDGSIVAFEDDIDPGVQTNSSLPVTGFFSLPQTGIYTIEATSFDNNATGGYTLKLSDDSSTNSVGFQSNSFMVGEGVSGSGIGTNGTGFLLIPINRNGTTGGDLGGTATIDYATSDGTASRHGDYEQTGGTIVFAPGQQVANISVVVPDDRFAEGPETFNITLSNPVGTTIDPTLKTTTVTISDNDTTTGPSPVRWDSNFNNGFFVRQQYLDFLARDPDQIGFNFWVNDLNSCGTSDPCAQVHRINVSAAFFLSIEFQETGYLVERVYKVAFGDVDANSNFPSPHTIKVPAVRLESFLPDSQRIAQGVIVGVGNWQQQLEDNKNGFAKEFVMRPAFISAYPLTMTPAQFVDKLNQNAGSVLTQPERDALIAQLASSADMAAGRGAVLRSIAENPVLNAQEKNRAFVLMQFFGYLRRNPNDAPDADYTGYDFWLQKLNQFHGDFVQAEMVKAFITSIEYNNRFGT